MISSKPFTVALVGVVAATVFGPWTGGTAVASQQWKLVDSAREVGSPAMALVKTKQMRPKKVKIVAAASPKQPMIVGWGWLCTDTRGGKRSRSGKRLAYARSTFVLNVTKDTNCTIMATARLERRIKTQAVAGRGEVKLLLYVSALQK